MCIQIAAKKVGLVTARCIQVNSRVAQPLGPGLGIHVSQSIVTNGYDQLEPVSWSSMSHVDFKKWQCCMP